MQEERTPHRSGEVRHTFDDGGIGTWFAELFDDKPRGTQFTCVRLKRSIDPDERHVDALIAGRDAPRQRAWLGVSTASTMSGGLLTAYVVRGINHKLLFAAQPLPPTNRQQVLHR